VTIAFLVATAALLLGFAFIERVVRHPLLARGLERLDGAATPLRTLALAGLLIAMAWSSPWEALGLRSEVRWLSFGVAAMLTWNAATRDRDPVTRGPSGAARLLLGLLALLSLQSPVCLALTALLLSARFGFWQHHAAFPMRILLLLVADILCVGLLQVARQVPDLAPSAPTWGQSFEQALSTLLVTMMVSHYLITALAKIWLGPRPWSWMLDNRLHYLAASAYSWGWARFVPWPQYLRFVSGLRRVEVPLQVFVFVLELTSPLALFDQKWAVAFAFSFAAFHVGVALVSGLCFWDWLLTDLGLGLFLLASQPSFGWPTFALGAGVLALFPLRHKLWKPMPLGWYDTPLTQRVHWFVRGVSGREYRVDNGFMCPHERLYGKVHGCFAVEAPVLTYHLGECFLPELRSAIVLAGPDSDALDRLRSRYGIVPKSAALTTEHVRYLQAFFGHLNAGASKAALPSWARWLKAPGDQMFYWGDGEAYRRQEPVRAVRLVFREEYFDGQMLVRLRDEDVLAFDVPPVREGAPPVRELTPREMDDYLLGLAAGRLIRVAGVRARYLAADDGIELHPSAPSLGSARGLGPASR